MLEVCFNDSVKGSLVMAQKCGNSIDDGATAVGFITDKKWILSYFAKRKALKEYRKRQIALQKQAVPLGGKREDIIGISFGLSEGDIKAPIVSNGCPRKEYISSTFSFDRHNDGADMEDAIKEFWEYSINDLEKLKSSSDKIRIWLDHTPDAQCGLLFVADLLKNSETEIHIVTLPEKIKRDDGCIVEYRGWGEIAPQLFGTFLDKEQIVSHQEIESLSNHWQKLMAENMPLRVVENGVVSSAEENYYDDLIRKEFPKETCKIANIIGNALGKQKILTGDVFIARRIQQFIASGELAVLGNTEDGFYSTTVGCTK